jgi:D-alanine-D-alanine ligase
MRIGNPRDFGQVAVLMGGESAEREVSLRGGRHVLDALLRCEVAAHPVDGVPELMDQIQAAEVDRVFNLLHGRGGEDGTIQGLLRCLNVPVTGAGVLGSALSMNKVMSKQIWSHQGLPTADFHALEATDDPEPAASALGYPLVVKPVSEGSSVGVSIVAEPDRLDAAVEVARVCERQIMLEAYVDGDEFTVGVLKGDTLPVVRIQPAREFYDYQAKYEDAGTEYLCPAGLDDSLEQHLRDLAWQAFRALGLSGWGRIDFLRDGSGQFLLLEANTTPGMTSHSLVPKAAAAAGVEFDQLVWRILETSFEEEHP